MISPSSFAVFALKFLQKSMMLTPCGPSAVPTGGAGVALPAAICNFTIACTFFAICHVRLTAETAKISRETSSLRSRRVRRLNLLHLQKVEFHRRRAAENRHHDLERVLLEVHLVD